MNPVFNVPAPFGENASHHGENTNGILTERDIHIIRSYKLWQKVVTGNVRPDEPRYSHYKDWDPQYPDWVKSRLFWRIRAGYPILIHRPPTCYSCPWYEVIEEDRPHTCWSDVAIRGKEISIAQCWYDLPIYDFKAEKGVARFGPYLFDVTYTGLDKHNRPQWTIQRQKVEGEQLYLMDNGDYLTAEG